MRRAVCAHTHHPRTTDANHPDRPVARKSLQRVVAQRIYPSTNGWSAACLQRSVIVNVDTEPCVGFGKLLVGTDFSEGAALALESARDIAQELGWQVHVAHVIEGAHGSWTPLPAASEWLERLNVARDDVTLRKGTAWIELVRIAVEREPTMIVVGSHGLSGFQPVALGTTAARLGIHSPYPVLVVTSGGNGKSGKRRAMRDRR